MPRKANPAVLTRELDALQQASRQDTTVLQNAIIPSSPGKPGLVIDQDLVGKPDLAQGDQEGQAAVEICGSPSGRIAMTISAEDVPHVALLFKWAYVVGTSEKASRFRRGVSLFVLASGLALLPQVSVQDENSFLYDHRDTTFGYTWTALNAFAAYAVLVVYRKQLKSMCGEIEYASNGDITAGHLVRVLAELDLDSPNSRWVRRWLRYACPVCCFLGFVFSLQGLAWIQWIGNVLAASPLEGFIWLWYYAAYLPLAALTVANFTVTLGVVCAAVLSHIQAIEELLSSEELTVRERCAEAMDLISDLKKNILPAIDRGYGEAVATMVAAGIAIGMGFLYKGFRFNVASSVDTFNNSTAAGSLSDSSDDTEYTKSMLVQDFLTGALYITMAQSVLLGPAKITTGCDKVRCQSLTARCEVGCLNVMTHV